MKKWPTYKIPGLLLTWTFYSFFTWDSWAIGLIKLDAEETPTQKESDPT